ASRAARKRGRSLELAILAQAHGAAATSTLEGFLVVVAAIVLFVGSVFLLLAAVFGIRMGYLMTATGFFGFWVLLAVLWTFGSWAFGAPGTLPNLGPRGELPSWIPVAQGTDLRSETLPVVDQYPRGDWRSPEDAAATAEVDPATLAFQEFLAEQANEELEREGIEGEVSPESFQVTNVRFADADDTRLAAATAFSATGGREVEVVGYLDEWNLEFPSWLALGSGLVGFAVHVPFLDRAERKRKDVRTGGEQSPWRGPA
ncbi:MAG TPA: hypothetical protein VG709_03245, partial [Actinomycetota bacterium]|nr:hypothetical protein [Actinomycetota bacterium]